MDDRTVTAALLDQFGYNESLYNVATKRIRASDTMFEDRVKLQLRPAGDEQWALLAMPYLLVCPTITRPQMVYPDQDQEQFINPRSIGLIAQLDGGGSEADWEAANQIELAEKQQLACLFNWRPFRNFKPTVYMGMRFLAARAPAVKVAFTFVCLEQVVQQDETTGLDGCTYLDRVIVNPITGCPCPPPEPCYPEPCPDPSQEDQDGQTWLSVRR